MAGLVVPDRDADRVVDLGNLLVALGEHDPAELDALLARFPPEVIEVVEHAWSTMAIAGWRASPAAMAAHLDTAFRRWRYIELLSDAFARAVRGESIRQIWNLPARYGKSWMASRWGPLWAMDQNPALNLALVSYGDRLAREHSSWILDTIRQHRDELNLRLRRDRQRGDRFVTTEGGGLIAAGVGSGLTGFPADGAVVDDPYKDWQDAHSPTRRLVVHNHYRSVIRLRMEHELSWIIVVHTRWHEEDLSGVLEAADVEGDGEGWEIIRIPALAEAPSTKPTDPPSLRMPDLLGRAPGEPIEPERFTLDAVEARASALGSYLAAGLEQQRPSPEEGTELLREWWQWYDSAPPKFDDAITSWDMKLKDKEAGDYVVGQAWGRTGPDMWLLDQLRGQWDQPTTTNAIALMQVRHPHIKRHVIENTGNGPEVMAALRKPMRGYTVSPAMAGKLGMTTDEKRAVEKLRRRGMAGLLPNDPKGSKTVRARAEANLIEAKHVHLPRNATFAIVLVDEAAAFPNGAHDDTVDAWSQAMLKLGTGSATARAATGTTTKPKPSARATTRGAAAPVPRVRRVRG